MYTFPEHNYPFFQGHREFFKIRDFIWPSDWMEKHFKLTTAYAAQGDIKLFPWQLFPLNMAECFEELTFIGPVQTGKSLLSEGVIGYKIDTDNQNIMFLYDNKDKVKDMIDERIIPLIKEVPAIKKYWSGADDDLAKRKIKLSHLIIHVGSAGIKGDIASYNAGIIVASELSNWPKKKFSQTRAIKGRKQASRMVGKKTFILYETSPQTDQDPSFEVAHRSGTVFLRPVYPCPKCGKYQLIYDAKIKEIPNKKGDFDHDPERIRSENAAYLECEFCNAHITEEQRLTMSMDVKWASVEPKPFRHEKIINIYNQDGKGLEFNERYAVCNWNRLVDVTWTFAECLASYFEALKSPNPEELKTYRNEDMADWVKLKADRYSESYLRSKCIKGAGAYRQYGDNAFVPDGVALALVGLDTQDNGFYYVIRGYGKGLESWLIRHDFIFCDKKDYENPADVYKIVYESIYGKPLIKRNGNIIPVLAGIIDRGGHRANDVDYLVSHNQNWNAYIGASTKTAPLIERKPSGIYHGYSENLSRIVASQIKSSIWHLPTDVGDEYLKQVLNHYDEEFTDQRGNIKKRFMTGKEHGKPDHLRDCEAYLVGLTNIINLQSMFHLPENVQKIQEITEVKKDQPNKPAPPKQQDNILGGFMDEMKGMGW